MRHVVLHLAINKVEFSAVDLLESLVNVQIVERYFKDFIWLPTERILFESLLQVAGLGEVGHVQPFGQNPVQVLVAV